MSLVFGAVDKRYYSFTELVLELGDGFGLLRKFTNIALTELSPFRRVVAEPFSQRGAGRDVLQPEIDLRRTLRNPPRPEPIYQNACAVRFFGWLIGALELDRAFAFERHTSKLTQLRLEVD